MKLFPVALITLGVGCLVAGVAYRINYEKWVTIPNARSIIAAEMRDPDSTQFRGDRITKSGWLCGEINSKNGSGGYVGFKRFASGGRPGSFFIEGQGSIGLPEIEEHIEILGKKVDLLKRSNEMRKQGVTLGTPSESTLNEQARAEIFEDKWKEICVE